MKFRHLIVFLLIIFILIGCDSGWSVCGWEVKGGETQIQLEVIALPFLMIMPLLVLILNGWVKFVFWLPALSMDIGKLKQGLEALKITLLLRMNKLGIYLINISWKKGLREKSWKKK